MEIGERLFVHPPWAREIPPSKLGIEIHPGMAFGTGQHATTRGCLIMLERFLAEKPEARVLDLGTGAGILAIAAVRLGADRVWAVDVDLEACRAARENAAVNGVAEQIIVSETADAVPDDCDLVLANLLAGQLVSFASKFNDWLRPGGIAIGSGILSEEEASVADAWTGAGLVALERYEEEGWVTLAWKRAVPR